ncbi:MAG: T9SS type A sorting domain-containing protein [Clostridia bacterium]|nr:T9SS type A sorting domain-containing protein [Clostridia bacterium]
MKKSTLLILAIALITGTSLMAQVPNGDFETWVPTTSDGEQPEGWMAAFNTATFANIFKVEGRTGLGAELRVLELPGFGVVAPILITEPFAVNQRHAKITGFLKGAPQGNDSLSIFVGMYTNSENLVGAGVGFVSQTFTTFSPFTVNVFYSGTETPDSCIVSFILGANTSTGTIGSSYTIDDVTFSGIAGQEELSPVFAGVGQAFPNPAASEITIPFELQSADEISVAIFDVSGKLLQRQAAQRFMPGANQIEMNVSDLSTGNYFYTLIPSDGISTSRKFVVK